MAAVIGSSEFEKKVINSNQKVLVDFFAPWCGPCKMMGPVIDELAEEMGDQAGIYKVNVDDSSDLANKFQVMSVPTILVFDKGKVIKQFNSVNSKEDLKAALTS